MSVPNKKTVRVHGLQLAYVDQGDGPTAVFLHGNPTSSFLWRNIIPPLSARYRCLAPDLIGMGDSEKLSTSGPEAYSFADHRHFLDGWFDAVVPEEPVVLVMHDWGAALGLDWAARNPTRVRAVAYMEAILGPVPSNTLPAPARDFFAMIRSDAGEQVVLQENVFLERMLTPDSITRPLSDAEREEYRRPFRTPGEGRRPTLSWPRLIPFDGEPAHITAITERFRAWLAASPVPKLLIVAEPGRILTPEMRALFATFPHHREATVPGLHYPQEDSPEAVTRALGDWLTEVVS